MATFKFTGSITVDGVRSKKEAITILQVMLNDFEDMNGTDTSVVICWDNIERIKKEDA